MTFASMPDDVTGNATPWTLLSSWANKRGADTFTVYTPPPYDDGTSTHLNWSDAAEITDELRRRLCAAGVSDQRVVVLAHLRHC